MIPLQVFTDQQITDIRSSISGTNYPSNYVLHQFGWDYYFLGNFWAIIIYNAIFLIFFLVLFAINYSSERFRQADNFVFRFLRRIPQRPLNYFDGLCRVQFITTIWCGLLQFQYYSTNVSIASISLETQVINLIITMVAFVGSTVWPFFVMIYTWNRHKHLNLNHFHYLYDDIFYRRISSLADEVQSYLYIGIRFGRLFLYTILVALLMRQPIVGPVLLIFANVLEGIIVFVLQVYRNNILMGFKLFENTLFVVTAVLVLIFTNFSTSSSISDSDYFNVGYGIIVCFVLMIINAFIRFTYLIYDKCKADNSFVLGE